MWFQKFMGGLGHLGIVTGNPGVTQGKGTGSAGLTGLPVYTGKARFIQNFDW